MLYFNYFSSEILFILVLLQLGSNLFRFYSVLVHLNHLHIHINFHLAMLLVSRYDEILCHTAFPRSFNVLSKYSDVDGEPRLGGAKCAIAPSNKKYRGESIFLFESQLFCTCETHFIFRQKCAHFNALYSVNALYIFPGQILFNYFFPLVTKIFRTVQQNPHKVT